MSSGLGATALLAGTAAGAKAAGAATKDKRLQIADLAVAMPTLVTPKNVSSNISPDELAVTANFDNLEADEGPDQNGAALGKPYCTAFIELPLANTDDQDLLGFTVDVRGSVSKSAGTRIAVNLDVGGVATDVEFPYGEQLDGNFHRRLLTPYPVNGLVDPTDSGSGSVKTYAARKFVALICLSVRRSGPTDTGHVKVDSLDVEAIRRPGSKQGGDNAATQKN